jgi:aminobenzoyl-glutamate utilization protein B
VYYTIGMDPTDRPLADFIVPLDAKRKPLDWLDRCRRRQLGGPDRSGPFADRCDRHAVPHLAGGRPGQDPAAHKAMVQAAKAMAGLASRR